jgi:trehalose synthase
MTVDRAAFRAAIPKSPHAAGGRHMTTKPPSPLTMVPVAPLPLERFRAVLNEDEYARLLALADRARELLAGRVVWCVNSTAHGGGVSEMLRSLLAYTRGAGVDTRWVVLEGRPAFFTLTKRLHNRLHDAAGDGGPLGENERAEYEAVTGAGAGALAELVQPDDVVILHDPQTAGMAPALAKTGAQLVWRAHIGIDEPTARVRTAWDFLRPYIAGVDAYVFSRGRFVWEGLKSDRVQIVPPSIDAFSAKNQDIADDVGRAILRVAGLLGPGPSRGRAAFVREDGTPGRVDRTAEVMQMAPLRDDDRVVVQVSRWDRLKDPVGVLGGFVAHVGERCDAHLVLAGPAVAGVADDPEGAAVLREVVDAWSALPDAVRSRVHIASLPMEDAEENAAIVNALQRHAAVVVQKSIAEGFGLTVAEALWKARPVVASAVGGIQDQITDQVTGLLVDPRDPVAFGHAVCRLLEDPELAARIGAAAHERVHDDFLEDRHLRQWVELIERLPAVTPAGLGGGR